MPRFSLSFCTEQQTRRFSPRGRSPQPPPARFGGHPRRPSAPPPAAEAVPRGGPGPPAPPHRSIRAPSRLEDARRSRSTSSPPSAAGTRLRGPPSLPPHISALLRPPSRAPQPMRAAGEREAAAASSERSGGRSWGSGAAGAERPRGGQRLRLRFGAGSGSGQRLRFGAGSGSGQRLRAAAADARRARSVWRPRRREGDAPQRERTHRRFALRKHKVRLGAGKTPLGCPTLLKIPPALFFPGENFVGMSIKHRAERQRYAIVSLPACEQLLHSITFIWDR